MKFIELKCYDCGKHLGWMIDVNAPHGMVFCDEHSDHKGSVTSPSREYLEMAVVQLADKKAVCLNRELFDKMLEFIKNRSGASAWWNDTRTYNLVTEIDEETGIGR